MNRKETYYSGQNKRRNEWRTEKRNYIIMTIIKSNWQWWWWWWFINDTTAHSNYVLGLLLNFIKAQNVFPWVLGLQLRWKLITQIKSIINQNKQTNKQQMKMNHTNKEHYKPKQTNKQTNKHLKTKNKKRERKKPKTMEESNKPPSKLQQACCWDSAEAPTECLVGKIKKCNLPKQRNKERIKTRKQIGKTVVEIWSVLIVRYVIPVLSLTILVATEALT